MKYIEEFRDSKAAGRLASEIRQTVTRRWTLMEICGGQTHAIARFGIDSLLPAEVELVHGPGCPVCVTPLETLDKAMTLAALPGVIFCTFADMLRVPGSKQDLFAVKAAGADIRMVYSPLDAVALAEKNPGRQVVFLAVGFETTAPANAMAVYDAFRKGLKNFSVLVSHVLVPPAMEALLSSPQTRVQAFLAAGHVCTVMGFEEYFSLASRFKVPIVVTGFEPLDILQGILMAVSQLEEGRAEVENQYTRAVRREGNRAARELIREIFCVIPQKWRGLGVIAQSGLGLRPTYAEFDAEKRFKLEPLSVEEPPECKSGLVLQGLLKPFECEAFGVLCTPQRPLGAPMVSSEGACAAYYHYKRKTPDPAVAGGRR